MSEKGVRVIFISIFLFFYSCNQSIEYKEFYANGGLKVVGELINNKKSGEWMYFDKEGNTTHVREYAEGVLIHEKLFDNKGLLFLKRKYEDGVQHGTERGFYQDGNTRFDRKYLDGFKEGESVSYYPNGEVFVKANYIQDTLRGEFFQYYLNGNIEIYAKDAGNSIHVFHDSLGNPTYNILFKDMVIIDTVKAY